MKSRAYSWAARINDFEGGRVAELHFDDHRVVQISATDDKDCVLIRMWTYEHGGGNGTEFAAVVRLTTHAVIESIDIRGPR